MRFNHFGFIWFGKMNEVILMCTVLGLTMVQFLIAQAYREHKVHNIVLYPDKHSWCKTTTIKQVISYPGCASVEIDNNVCVGACFSYSIPHTEPSDPGEVIVPYCDSCQPSDTTWHQITLQCNKNDADSPSHLIKNVQIIHNCSCTPCEKNSQRLKKFPENNEELLMQQNVDTELLNALHNRNESSYNYLDNDRWSKMHLLLNQKLITLLKSIEANNTDHDKEQLMDLFNVIQDPMKQKAKATNIYDFIETLQTNKTELDKQRLTELLLNFEYSKEYKLENDNLNPENPSSSEPAAYDEEIHNSQVAKDSGTGTDNTPSKETILSNLPIAVWVHNAFDSKPELLGTHQAAASSEVNSETRTNPSSSNEHGQPPDVSNVSVEKNAVGEHVVGEGAYNHLHPHSHSHLHQHHINDNIAPHGHLTRGPHGALVIESDPIHEKLDVNAHELKPNHAGTLLSYHSHAGEGNGNK